MNKYGLIGYPLKHSFSSKFFNEKFKNESLDAEYINYEIETVDKLISIIKSDSSLNGLNVTIPHKQNIIPYLNELDDTAKEIGAVNVIKVIRTNNNLLLKGYNSDTIGFRKSIEPLIDKNIHTKALILGTGGAAKAVEYSLNKMNIPYKYVSRTKKGDNLIYDELDSKIIEEYKIIINASPVGTFPNVDAAPKLPYQYITDKHLLYDLVYNPPLTKFLALGQERGAVIKNGYEMLELQALAAWNIWNL